MVSIADMTGSFLRGIGVGDVSWVKSQILNIQFMSSILALTSNISSITFDGDGGRFLK